MIGEWKEDFFCEDIVILYLYSSVSILRRDNIFTILLVF